MNTLSYQRIQFQFTICYADSLLIHYHSREFNMISLSFLRIHYDLIFLFAIYRSITFFVNSELIPYLFHEFTMSSLSVTRIYQGFIILFVINMDPFNFPWIQNWFKFFSRNHCGSIIISVHSLSVLRIHFWSIIRFAKSMWIHYQVRELSMNLLWFS